MKLPRPTVPTKPAYIAHVWDQHKLVLGMSIQATREEAVTQAERRADIELTCSNPRWKSRKASRTVKLVQIDADYVF